MLGRLTRAFLLLVVFAVETTRVGWDDNWVRNSVVTCAALIILDEWAGRTER